MNLLRLVTVHPIFVHLTIGLVPLMVLAYVLARAFRSDRWAFVGDVTLYTTAIVTVATAVFGLVSYVTLDWPGGLSTWAALHLAFGTATAVLLLAFAGYRVGNRHQRPHGGWPAIGGSLSVAVLVAFTGWIGGELLVYRGGMAVQAAADGALAPTVGEPDLRRPPHPSGVTSAMAELRGNWAVITTTNARMLVEHPTDAAFAQIGRRATRVSQLATWLVAHANAHQPAPAGGSPSARIPAFAPADRGAIRGAIEPEAGGAVDGPSEAPGSGAGDRAPGAVDSERNQRAQMAKLAGELQTRATQLGAAAARRDLVEVTLATGQMATTCARCHEELRWRVP